MEWEEPAIVSTHQCQETMFNGQTLYCGTNGTKEVQTRSLVGGGVMEEVTNIPCMNCTDLLTWTSWGPCTEPGQNNPGAICRKRGNEMIGFEEEYGGKYLQ